jgi:hypothetical protein
MIRCPWCGAHNYAIDSWCSRCSRHLDFEPPAPKARPQTDGKPAGAPTPGSLARQS